MPKPKNLKKLRAEIFADLRQALERAQSVSDLNGPATLAIRKATRWLPPAERDQVVHRIGQFLGEAALTKFQAQTVAMLKASGDFEAAAEIEEAARAQGA